jgi:thiol:disulfide interchange protein
MSLPVIGQGGNSMPQPGRSRGRPGDQKKTLKERRQLMGEINWRDNWNSALEEAKKENRRVLLELYMDGCPHCTRLHNETHADAGVVQEVNSQYIPVRLEGRSHMDIVKQFNVTGAPTTLVFGADGKELHRFPGFYSPLDYLKQLEQAV